MIVEYGISQRQACKAAGVARTSMQHQKKIKEDELVIEQIRILTEKHPATPFLAKLSPAQKAGLCLESQTGLQSVYRYETEHQAQT